MVETWKPIEGFEGFYEVSDLGRVRSVDRIIYKANKPDVPVRYRGRLLVPTKSGPPKNQYLSVSMWKMGRLKIGKVHRLVATAFVEGKTDDLFVLHKDDVRLNNVATNLYWGTPKQNMEDMLRNGHNFFANKTHCPKGHEYTEENTIIRPNGNRGCRDCGRAAKNSWYARVVKPRNAAILAEKIRLREALREQDRPLR